MNLTAHPFGYSCFLAVELGNHLFNDNPLNVLVGFAGLLLLRHREKWLLWVSFVVPITVGMVLLPTTPARGTSVAGNTIILFAVVSHCAVEASRWIDRRISPRLAVVPIVVPARHASGLESVVSGRVAVSGCRLCDGGLRECRALLAERFLVDDRHVARATHD